MPIKADKSLRAYYNEIDPSAAQWIRNLMAEGWITKGDVDERSIEDVQPNDIAGYDRLHFFAGVAVWDYALNQAGWGRGEIWTGSCPCQPFSAAGKGAGFDDERHLWPAFHHLISQCKPAIVLGEQVASKDADTWIDLVHTDMEALGYAFGAIPFPAAGIGAPHIRDRLYWVAGALGDTEGGRYADGNMGNKAVAQRTAPGRGKKWNEGMRRDDAANAGATGWLADTQQHHRGSQAAPTNHGKPKADRSTDWAGGCGRASGGLAYAGSQGLEEQRRKRSEPTRFAEANLAGGVADTESGRRGEKQSDAGWCIEGAGEREAILPAGNGGTHRPGPTNGFWRDADWLGCRDGKWRPVEPGSFPLAYGAPARVGRLRAYGNGLCAIQAQGFIESVMDYMGPSV